jgi:RNA polymerase sigma-70 factor (ECF subfamily)
VSGEALADIHREEGPQLLATLIRYLGGNFTLAEDSLQDAYAVAAATWPRDGVPANPAGWLIVTARRRAIDRLRRERVLADRVRLLEDLVARDRADFVDPPDEAELVADDRLRLIFTCCHPALSLNARVALTLRSLGGLTTPEIARAFLVSEATMAQRVVRAKRKITEARIPYRVPDAEGLVPRLGGVLAVIYLIFNEGYSASEGDRLVRGELCSEAIRLGRLLHGLLPREPEPAGLLALMLLHDSRRATRTDAAGNVIGLPDQDRALWDQGRIAEGLTALERAVAIEPNGAYTLQAAIAAQHATSPSAEATDWTQIAGLYARLSEVTPSLPVDVNHAVAIGFAGDVAHGLRLLARAESAQDAHLYQPLYAARAELLARGGEIEGAREAYRRAIELTPNSVTRRELERRRRAALAPRS